MANVLERVLKRLNGSEASSAIAGALVDLQSGRADKRAKLAALQERRAQALKDFEYAKARSLEDDIADVRRQIASDDLHEPELQDRLTIARATEAVERGKSMALAYLAKTEEFAKAVAAADAIGREAAAIFERDEPLLRGIVSPQGCALVLGAPERWGCAWAGGVFDYCRAMRARLDGKIDKLLL